MIDTPLHTGAQHPNLLWALIPSIFSFAVGIVLGSFSDRLRDWIQHGQPVSND